MLPLAGRPPPAGGISRGGVVGGNTNQQVVAPRDVQTNPRWYSTFWMCVYIYITVTCHVPLFSLAWSLVTEYTALELDDTSARVIDYAVSCIDAHLYVFFAVLVMLLHRMICGRRLWTRFAGRTVVVVDSTVNYKLLRAFGSKLGALAFPFTAFRVTGQRLCDCVEGCIWVLRRHCISGIRGGRLVA